MKMHVLRPLFVVIVFVGLILLVRHIVVPEGFGIHERGYMYGWYDKADEERWKSFKIKYKGSEYCKDCHTENYKQLITSAHRIMECENCHGPAIGHPDDPPKLEIDRGRDLCLRCHAFLNYPTSGRSRIKGFADPDTHNPGLECTLCHNPHHPEHGRKP